ncbi:hypothetical protein ACFL1U_01460 [Patescibacteria group bacterium]
MNMHVFPSPKQTSETEVIDFKGIAQLILTALVVTFVTSAFLLL